ncbi:Neuron-specific calcium-binding protein hippocalcin [Fasciola gigantica]|uniref:Neuron-specific calcium-binding protein hippocalcin n=1 Tax=Fasciola gigantica TaxID=46835 RepID=A0A504Y6J8_FASGI|nr:Neuron-specific calcium-binding protein hippocalcin [Fasciola gigantica]
MGGTHSTKNLPKEEIKKLATKTHFTEAQIRRWYKDFLKDCPSGLLNRSTFLSMYTQFFPDGKARQFYEHLFRTFDADASGNIDFTEFLTAISITQSGGPEEKLDLAFQLYDIDRNGTIEESEMTQIIKAIHLMVGEVDDREGNSPAERTRAIFKKMDVNCDRVLTKEEFIQGCLSDEHLYRLLAQTKGGKRKT